ncbi:hypothetical protein KIN20_030844 [Parelaphostrongylus tenuis]|uniref:Uncharacterized protein n=1 Tax=Parelaphostrongylus tenuis TaxID=148309 RepID=A0AAD5R4C8_PARTN|nr:hypothetical protein KIN20_030844 [Parelaphostrongylus tenuis]
MSDELSSSEITSDSQSTYSRCLKGVVLNRRSHQRVLDLQHLEEFSGIFRLTIQ